MQVSVSGHHFNVSRRVREHVAEGAAKLERFYTPLIDCQVVITEEKRERKVDIVVNLQAQSVKASHEAESVYVSIDAALDKVKRQLKKLHDKRRKPRVTSAREVPEVVAEAEE